MNNINCIKVTSTLPVSAETLPKFFNQTVRSSIFESSFEVVESEKHNEESSSPRTKCISIISEGIDVKKHLGNDCIRYSKLMERGNLYHPSNLYFSPKKDSYISYFQKENKIGLKKKKVLKSNFYRELYDRKEIIENTNWLVGDLVLGKMKKMISQGKNVYIDQKISRALSIENFNKNKRNVISY